MVCFRLCEVFDSNHVVTNRRYVIHLRINASSNSWRTILFFGDYNLALSTIVPSCLIFFFLWWSIWIIPAKIILKTVCRLTLDHPTRIWEHWQGLWVSVQRSVSNTKNFIRYVYVYRHIVYILLFKKYYNFLCSLKCRYLHAYMDIIEFFMHLNNV